MTVVAVICGFLWWVCGGCDFWLWVCGGGFSAMICGCSGSVVEFVVAVKVCGFDGGAAGVGVVGFVFRWVLWCRRWCG